MTSRRGAATEGDLTPPPGAPPIVTLLTDFGSHDPFVGILKGVLLSIAPEARIVDLTHEVPPQDAFLAGLHLRAAAPYFPRGTVHVVVVDPGVGTEREILAAEASGQRFLAPDNGILPLALRGRRLTRLHAVRATSLFLRPTSRTFHGRDILAPVAAHLARGMPLDRLGPRTRWKVALDEPRPRRLGRDAYEGVVLDVDRFGNCVTNLDRPFLRRWSHRALRRLRVEIGGRCIEGLSETYGAGEGGTLLLHLNSSERLEIAARGANAAKILSVGRGAPLRLSVGGKGRDE